MASYTDLYDLFTDPNLKERMAVAVIVEADAIRLNGAATTAMKGWARAALADPDRSALMALRAVIGQNSSATIAAITGATDAVLQAALHNAVPLLAGE